MLLFPKEGTHTGNCFRTGLVILQTITIAKALPVSFLGEEGEEVLLHQEPFVGLIQLYSLPHWWQGLWDEMEIQIALSVDLKVCSGLNRICVLNGQSYIVV